MKNFKKKVKENFVIGNKKLNIRMLFIGLIFCIAFLSTFIKDLVIIIDEKAYLQNDSLYIFPPINSKLIQNFILNNLTIIGVILGIPIGFLISYIITLIYLWLFKKYQWFFKKFLKKYYEKEKYTFGFVEIDPQTTSITTILFRATIAGFLTMSLLFIYIENNYFSVFWWKNLNDYQTTIATQPSGLYSELILLPWLWISLAISSALLVACWIILDSGLIIIKKKSSHKRYRSVGKVGNYFYKYLKGFVTLSLLISWLLFFLQINVGIAVLPINSLIYFVLFVIILDYFKPFTRNIVMKGARKIFPSIDFLTIETKQTLLYK